MPNQILFGAYNIYINVPLHTNIAQVIPLKYLNIFHRILEVHAFNWCTFEWIYIYEVEDYFRTFFPKHIDDAEKKEAQRQKMTFVCVLASHMVHISHSPAVLLHFSRNLIVNWKCVLFCFRTFSVIVWHSLTHAIWNHKKASACRLNTSHFKWCVSIRLSSMLTQKRKLKRVLV